MQLIPKPYKLYNKIQNYAWGTKNGEAFIPSLLEMEVEENKPYAELWIGAHPKAPSEISIQGISYLLNNAITEFPHEILGEYVSKKFNNKLPFLLKVLSAGEALSIQTHPNKKQAEILHVKDPVNYPDDNHKPEVAIAVDKLIAVAGFRPITEIQNMLKQYSEFSDLIGNETYTKIIEERNSDKLRSQIEFFYKQLLQNAHDKEKLILVIDGIHKKIKIKDVKSLYESQFLKQFEIYGHDIGLLSLLIFNSIELKSNQGIFTDAGVPHAYIHGNIIECMANSDNVVRAGLTNKFKDIDVLLEIVKYEFKNYDIINFEQENDNVVYKTSAEEFEIVLFNKDSGYTENINSNNKPETYLLTNGKLEVAWLENNIEKKEIYSKGESFLVPANLSKYNIKVVEESSFIKVIIP